MVNPNTQPDGGGVRTRGKNPIALSVRPADDLPHLLQRQLFHEHEDGSDLVGEPGINQKKPGSRVSSDEHERKKRDHL